jgi:hypothetical protein
MLNSFLFIIPLTPDNYLTEDRRALRKLCLSTLLSQHYVNWMAILVGTSNVTEFQSEKLLQIDFEGPKEEKLQIATDYIIKNSFEGDYIIRLDDDDIFNPNLLNLLGNLDFDLYVDKYHRYWNITNGKVSKMIRYWYPNTCILKRKHALTTFGHFPPGNYKKFKDSPLLIENEHNDFHLYFNQSHNIVFAKTDDPVYIRTLNPHSITSLQGGTYEDYLETFGFWENLSLKSYTFLKHAYKSNAAKAYAYKKQGFISYIKSAIANIIASRNFFKLVIAKK